MKKFYIAGGDERLFSTKRALLADGHEVAGDPDSGIEDALFEMADVVLCGVPFTGDGRHLFAPYWRDPYNILALIEKLSPGQLLLGGSIPEPVIRSLEKKGIRWGDYAKEEPFQVKNALLTAEGAILLALRHMKITIHQSEILIFGYGRIGKMLAARLAALGAHVTVVTGKKENIPWLESRGMTGISAEDVPDALPRMDGIFNTVPETVMEREMWERVKETAVAVELASRPGGFRNPPEGRVIPGAALPGKTAPVSAGLIIKNTVMEMIEREGNL